MTKKGIFITFEGADGCGKSTQAQKISEYLQENNIEYVLTRDPGGTALGAKLRNILLHHDGMVSSTCETLLYLADRAQHIEEKILPALNEGKIVLCDRHIDSTVAYQGYARGLDIDNINFLNKLATQNRLPDLTLLFDVETDVAMKRVGETKDRLESEGIEFHRKVRNGYLELAEKYPERIKIINANNSIDQVFEDAIKIIKNKLEI
ncbi:MAG: dTMP kinase [Candidatus Gastranaerophilales bacterium]|nr:dTMP kinase [Candidatus Gastranaerophilales bacterium]